MEGRGDVRVSVVLWRGGVMSGCLCGIMEGRGDVRVSVVSWRGGVMSGCLWYYGGEG